MPSQPTVRWFGALLAALIQTCTARQVDEGALLTSPPAGTVAGAAWGLLDMRSGRWTALPVSDFARHYQSSGDTWTADTLKGDLVRTDEGGHIDFFDRRTLRRTGGFSLKSIPGADEPKLLSLLKPSRDGKFLLGYWKPSYRIDEPVLTVFDRNGRVLQSAPPIARTLHAWINAFDWLPNDQFVYAVEDKIVLGEIGNWALGAGRLDLPGSVKPEGGLAVSPDAKRLVLAMTTASDSAPVANTTLFTAHLNGSNARPLTDVQPEGRTAVRQGHTSPSWAPSGKWLAFALSTTGSLSPGAWGSGCPPVLVAPADGPVQQVNALRPSSDMSLSATGQAGQIVTPSACGSLVLWIAR